MLMSDEKVSDLSEKFNIKALLEQASARAAQGPETDADMDDDGGRQHGVPSLDKLTPLPKPGDAYIAYARPTNLPVPTIFFIKSDGTVWGHPYANRAEGPHLVPADDAGKGWMIVLRFSGLVPTEAILTGRRLDALHNYLGDQRIRWVRELPKGKTATDPDAPVITGIIVKELER
jgi:hypothetical protein